MSGSFGMNKSGGKQQSQSQSGPLSVAELNAYWRNADKLTGGRYKKGKQKEAGRLATWAKEGTAQTQYTPLQSGQYFNSDLSYAPVQADVTYRPVSDDQIRALGGAGATRELNAQRARQMALDEMSADPTLTVAQRQRSSQMTNRDYTDMLDAIGKESEASLTQALLQQAAAEQAGRQAQAGFTADQAAQVFAARQAAAQQMQQAGAFDADQNQLALQNATRNADLNREDLGALAEIIRSMQAQKSSSSSSGKQSAWGFTSSGGVGAS